MLSVYFGSDRKSSVDAANEAVKKVGQTATIIDEHSYQPGQFIDLTTSTSLFSESAAFIIDSPSSKSEFNDECINSLTDMAESANHFFIIEGTLLAPAKRKLEKHAEVIEEFSADKPERFNVFGMAEALVKRDKKKLWLMTREASLLGIPEEEMIGILWWQLKSMRLAAVTSSASEAGMKDYPYRKAKQSLNKFSTEEVEDLSHSLLRLYHEGHKGVVDIKLALEKWVLQL